MLSKRFFIVLGIVVAIVAIALVSLYYHDPSRAMVTGAILKVRSQAVDESSCLVVVDFRFNNPSNSVVQVRSVSVVIDGQDAKEVPGDALSEMDAARLMQYYPTLGQKYNDTLVIKAKVEPKQTMDRMICARFPISEAQFNARKKLKVRIEDWGGPISEIEK